MLERALTRARKRLDDAVAAESAVAGVAPVLVRAAVDAATRIVGKDSLGVRLAEARDKGTHLGFDSEELEMFAVAELVAEVTRAVTRALNETLERAKLNAAHAAGAVDAISKLGEIADKDEPTL